LLVEINSAVNVDQVEDINKQNQLVEAIEGAEHLVLTERKLIKEGGILIKDIQKPNGHSQGGVPITPAQFYYFFLFNDVLVCCELQTNLETGKQFKHRETIKLKDIQNIQSNGEKEIIMQLKLSETDSSVKEVWIFEFRNSKDQEAWQLSFDLACKSLH